MTLKFPVIPDAECFEWNEKVKVVRDVRDEQVHLG